jgi:hypothetical protein
MRKIIKEPLDHFLLVGALVFLLTGWLSPDNQAGSDTITIDDGVIAGVSRTYEL